MKHQVRSSSLTQYLEFFPNFLPDTQPAVYPLHNSRQKAKWNQSGFYNFFLETDDLSPSLFIIQDAF